MTNSQSAVPNSDGYIPPNTVYAPTTTWNSEPSVDFSFLRTKFGFAKVLQQIFIVLGTVGFAWGVSESLRLVSLPMTIGFFLYFILLFILLPIVHVLMWLYICHKVEKFQKYPWYTIEFIICGVGVVLCCLSAFAPLYVFISSLSALMFFSLLFTLFAASLFIYNLFLINQRRNMNLKLQGSELAMYPTNLT